MYNSEYERLAMLRKLPHVLKDMTDFIATRAKELKKIAESAI